MASPEYGIKPESGSIIDRLFPRGSSRWKVARGMMIGGALLAAITFMV
jgi:hypothetical protein